MFVGYYDKQGIMRFIRKIFEEIYRGKGSKQNRMLMMYNKWVAFT